jgi:2-hydroxy-3-oxopropionate reductase
LVRSNRQSAASDLITAGARWAATPAELAGCAVVVLMVRDLDEVSEVLDGPQGLATGDTPIVVVVSSTVSPDGLRTLAARVSADSAGRVRVIDAPVSGGEEGAVAGTLSIMVGGGDADVAVAWPVLTAMGVAAHLGPLGAGQVAKACNQMIVASTLVALGEAVVLARRSGLDIGGLLRLLRNGLADSRVLETKLDRLVSRDYTPSGPARFMVKDLGFALAEAERTGVVTDQTRVVHDLFVELVARGFGDQDTSVLQAFVESRSAPPGGT